MILKRQSIDCLFNFHHRGFSNPRFIVAFGVTEQEAQEKCEAMALAEGGAQCGGEGVIQ